MLIVHNNAETLRNCIYVEIKVSALVTQWYRNETQYCTQFKQFDVPQKFFATIT
jgi:hypothetical protein